MNRNAEPLCGFAISARNDTAEQAYSGIDVDVAPSGPMLPSANVERALRRVEVITWGLSMSFLDRLSLTRKLMLLGIMAVVAILIPTSLYVKQVMTEVAFAHRETEAIEPTKALHRVIRFTQQHRGISAGMLGGNEALAAKRPEVRDAVKKAIVEFERTLEGGHAPSSLVSQWSEHKQRWTKLEEGVSARQLKTSESTAQHTQLIAGLLAIGDTIRDEYGMSLDPVADTYFLIQATTVYAPELTESLGQMRAMGTGHLAAGKLSAEALGPMLLKHGQATERFHELMKNIAKSTKANQQLQAQLATKADALKAQINKTLDLADQQVIKAAELTFSPAEYFQKYTETIDAVYSFGDLAFGHLGETLNARASAVKTTAVMTLGFLAFIVAAGGLLSVLFVRSIVSQLGAEPSEATMVVRAVAAGDLSVPIHLRAGDTNSLMAQLKTMQGSLEGVVEQVRQGSISVASASAEIAQGNQDLSSRTEQQASALEETASSMEELGSTVRQNADSARQANELANGASAVAIKGGTVVGQVVDTMKGINDASKKISDIISVIDGIAFQTNILALNAAVEAARAGEQGRGFAVVASEVRSLAQRSADAAKEIKTLINASVEP
jgi:Methyl-accepting chemotaxis protein (MCP) signalling domain